MIRVLESVLAQRRIDDQYLDMMAGFYPTGALGGIEVYIPTLGRFLAKQIDADLIGINEEIVSKGFPSGRIMVTVTEAKKKAVLHE